MGQPVCDEAPHCRFNLFATYPEGICLSTVATAANCGTLGNAPCDTGRRCETGLSVRCVAKHLLAPVAAVRSRHTKHCNPYEPVRAIELVTLPCCCRSGICAPALSQPCGLRGFPICLGRSNLCLQLLSPSFPSMVCVDSSRSEQEPCGVLATSACLDLECASGLVVHPSTKVCVPPAEEPCGAARQAQCFWDGAEPCQEGLEPKGGICSEPAS